MNQTLRAQKVLFNGIKHLVQTIQSLERASKFITWYEEG